MKTKQLLEEIQITEFEVRILKNRGKKWTTTNMSTLRLLEIKLDGLRCKLMNQH